MIPPRNDISLPVEPVTDGDHEADRPHRFGSWPQSRIARAQAASTGRSRKSAAARAAGVGNTWVRPNCPSPAIGVPCRLEFTAVIAGGTTVVVEERMRAMDTRRAEQMFAVPEPDARRSSKR